MAQLVRIHPGTGSRGLRTAARRGSAPYGGAAPAGVAGPPKGPGGRETSGRRTASPATLGGRFPLPYRGTMSGAPRRAASAVRSSGWRWDSRSASTRFW
ncbi:hypothetical protein GCM10010378_68240 [Streptomyces viridochromogenes]